MAGAGAIGSPLATRNPELLSIIVTPDEVEVTGHPVSGARTRPLHPWPEARPQYLLPWSSYLLLRGSDSGHN
jgi:hypothetical protein